MSVGFGMFARVIALGICWYDSHMKGREADRERRSRSQ